MESHFSGASAVGVARPERTSSLSSSSSNSSLSWTTRSALSSSVSPSIPRMSVIMAETLSAASSDYCAAARARLATSSASVEQTESTMKPLHERVVPRLSAEAVIVCVIYSTKLAQESAVSGS